MSYNAILDTLVYTGAQPVNGWVVEFLNRDTGVWRPSIYQVKDRDEAHAVLAAVSAKLPGSEFRYRPVDTTDPHYYHYVNGFIAHDTFWQVDGVTVLPLVGSLPRGTTSLPTHS